MIARSITIRITGRAVAILLAALALVWLVVGFSKILFILFLAILLAVGIDPLVDRMERWKLPRSLAIFIIYLGILGVLVSAVALLVPVLVQESSQLADSLPRIAQQVGEGPHRRAGTDLRPRVDDRPLVHDDLVLSHAVPPWGTSAASPRVRAVGAWCSRTPARRTCRRCPG